MKMSIRHFLLIHLLLGELVATGLGILAILFLGHSDAQTNLDNRLLQAAFTMQTFMSQPHTLKNLQQLQDNITGLSTLFSSPWNEYSEAYPDSKIFHYHVWDAKGKILLGSQDIIPDYFMNAPIGFSQLLVQHQLWRAFTTIDPNSQVKITLLQQKNVNSILPNYITREVILIMLSSYPFLGILMWIILSRGLKVLQIVSSQVQQQAPEHLSHIDSSNLPVEIKPLAEEWNKLFDRLKLAFDREKRFAADAAHELKTPLAALKTHTQLALNAKNENELINALQKIVTGVNRSAHVVHQLLTLNRMSQGIITETPVPVDIVQQAKEVIADLVPQALEKNSEIELIADDINSVIPAHHMAVAILMRNLIDNAIRYSPEHSLVQVIIEESADKENLLLKVIDNGPGVPEHLRQRVFERFFRVIGNKSSGSGLGLGIVQQIVELHQAFISLETPACGHGLQVTVVFPRIHTNSSIKIFPSEF